MILSGLIPQRLAFAGRAALVGFATLLLPMTPSMGQDAPDREDVSRESDENRFEALDVTDVEYTAGPREKGEAKRDRPERRGRAEGRSDSHPHAAVKEESDSRAKVHAEMRHAQKELVKAAHRIVDLEAKISAHHEEGRGEHHVGRGPGPRHDAARADRHEGEARGGHREDGASEHHADRARGGHREDGASEHHADRARGERHEPRGENAHKPTGHMIKGGSARDDSPRAKNAPREMELDKKGEGRAHDRTPGDGPKPPPSAGPKRHDDQDARINQIEKKLDELIRVVHGMKSHEGKDKDEQSKK